MRRTHKFGDAPITPGASPKREGPLEPQALLARLVDPSELENEVVLLWLDLGLQVTRARILVGPVHHAVADVGALRFANRLRQRDDVLAGRGAVVGPVGAQLKRAVLLNRPARTDVELLRREDHLQPGQLLDGLLAVRVHHLAVYRIAPPRTAAAQAEKTEAHDDAPPSPPAGSLTQAHEIRPPRVSTRP